MWTTLSLIGGFIVLGIGAEGLVRGASRLASALGISPLVVGLTVVAFGTSAPEMSVSVMSAMENQADIALGNVVGSNIFNILFILGLSAAIAPLIVHRKLVLFDVPVMIASTLGMWWVCSDGLISQREAIVLFGFFITYIILCIRRARYDSSALKAEVEKEVAGLAAEEKPRWILNVLLVLGGLALLVLGSKAFVWGAVRLATVLGVSELVIGLTIVAAGTSLPEVATSVLAAIRKETDIAVGNVVGSNIFNILSVLGASGFVSSKGINVAPSALALDIPVSAAVAIACLPVFLSGYVISRWKGLLFLGLWAAYTTYLVLHSAGHDALPMYSKVMWYFVLPLTALTLGALFVRAFVVKPPTLAHSSPPGQG